MHLYIDFDTIRELMVISKIRMIEQAIKLLLCESVFCSLTELELELTRTK